MGSDRDDDEPKTYEVFGEGDERNDLGEEERMVNGVGARGGGEGRP